MDYQGSQIVMLRKSPELQKHGKRTCKARAKVHKVRLRWCGGVLYALICGGLHTGNVFTGYFVILAILCIL